MRIAVTGGAGFLGFHIRQKLHGKNGHEIRLLDIAEPPADERASGVDFRLCDVRDLAALKEHLAGCDAVIHAAAALPLFKREDIYMTNICGTENVMFVCRELGIRRVVHVSSTAVYGVPKKHPLYETDPMVGVGPYGITKIKAEEICQKYRRFGMCICVVRPKTFLGTGRLGVFQILYDWIESGKKIPVVGSGYNRYQLLEVQDLVDAIHLGLTVPEEKANDTFNIGAERFSTVRDDIGAVCAHAGYEKAVMGTFSWMVKPALAFFEAVKLSPLYKWVYGTADKDSFVSIDKAKSQLGWQPQFSNAEALLHAFDWYRQNKSKVPTGSGVTHRIGWDQGILKVFKKIAPNATPIVPVEATPAALPPPAAATPAAPDPTTKTPG